MAFQVPQVYSTLGPHLVSGSSLNSAIGNQLQNYNDGVTALAGGGQANAVQLSSGISKIATVATANDSVKLPPSKPGTTCLIQNSTANACQVFSNSTSSLPAGTLDTINGTAGATGISVAAGKTAMLSCTAYGAWFGPVALA